MARTLFEHLSPDTGPKRALALDGGGVKGMLTLGMLKPLEAELRRRAGGSAEFRLSDYYDLIGGTSIGALIAACLALGMSVEEVTELYAKLAPEVYGHAASDGVLVQSKFDSAKLRRALTGVIGTKTLGSDELKTGLAICSKRIDSGAVWIVTNHPLSPAYDPPADSTIFPHKRYRLLDLVLASVGAPNYLDEMVIDIEFDEKRHATKKGYFVDGAVGANGNPSLQIMMLVLEPAQRFGWKPGGENFMITSCGAGARRPHIDGRAYQGLPPGVRGAHALRSMAFDAEMQAVRLLQALSNPRRAWRAPDEPNERGETPFSVAPVLDFQRFDVALDEKPKAADPRDPAPPMTALERLIGRELDAEVMEQLDQMANGKKENLDLLREIGEAAGGVFVDRAYPDPRFDLPEWRAPA